VVVVRKFFCSAFGFAGFAFGLTLLHLGMRGVLDVGGACASGGPYASAQPCPPGTVYAILGFLACGVGAALIAAGSLPHGPRLVMLTWSSLFLVLGWNFLDYGLLSGEQRSSDAGLVVCAVLFGAMGGLPLLRALAHPTRTFWGDDEFAPSSPFPIGRLRTSAWPGGGLVRVVLPSGPVRPGWAPPTAPPSDPHAGGSSPDPGPTDAEDLVVGLERLSAMHRNGELTDEEFAQAKKRLFEERS